jgi:DNA-directed RNA polymerase specialized sigma24 family protein
VRPIQTKKGANKPKSYTLKRIKTFFKLDGDISALNCTYNKNVIMHFIHNREEFFTRLYKKAFPVVAKYISRRGGSFYAAKDVFHDALVIYYEKTVQQVLNKDIDETAYVVGIAKHLWLRKFSNDKHVVSLDGVEISIDDEEELSAPRIMRFLTKAGSKCMELLKSFYYDEAPLNEIAETFGFSGVRSATVQKYKCLEKVRETIKQKALQYEDFVE